MRAVACVPLAALLLLCFVASTRAQEPVRPAVPPTSTTERRFTFEPPPAVSETEPTALFTSDEYLREFVRRYGPEVATMRVSDAGDRLGRSCHHRAHDLGRIAFDLFGPEAFALVGLACQGGAMHGVTTGALEGRTADDLARDIGALCATSEGAFLRGRCVHGIGHGLMIALEYELTEALELCDTLAEEADRTACHHGVFMENVDGGLSTTMAHKSHYLRQDDAHYPCSVLEQPYVVPCYFFQASHMYDVLGRDFGRVAAECATVPAIALKACFQSMGRVVSEQTVGRPDAAIETCGLIAASAERPNCLEQVVLNWFWGASRADVALQLCGLLEGPEALTCYWSIAWQGIEVFPDLAEYQTFCARFATGYGWLCNAVQGEKAKGNAAGGSGTSGPGR